MRWQDRAMHYSASRGKNFNNSQLSHNSNNFLHCSITALTAATT